MLFFGLATVELEKRCQDQDRDCLGQCVRVWRNAATYMHKREVKVKHLYLDCPQAILLQYPYQAVFPRVLLGICMLGC